MPLCPLHHLRWHVVLCLSLVSTPWLFAEPVDGNGPDDSPGKFEKVQLTQEYFAEGAAVGDFNNDGHLDIVCGPHWFAGPDWKQKHTFYDGKAFPNDRGYSDNFFSFVDDFNGDGYDDVLVVGLPGTPAYWYENSRTSDPWTQHFAFPAVDPAAPTFADLTGDGRPELICHFEGQLGFAAPNQNDPTARWNWRPISEKGNWGRFTHGLGIGDVNGDGRVDFLMPTGWWEHPEDWDGNTPWKHHAYRFAPGGAGIHTADLDGDGDNDVVTSLHGHGYGLVWHEQISGENGQITFRQHTIMGERPDENPHGVAFSQLHAVELADINGDGIPDIVTGKCYWAHNGNDPGARDPAVVYAFLTQRGDQGVSFLPVQADNDSGTGRQVTVADVSSDGKLDLVTGNKKGTFLLLQR